MASVWNNNGTADSSNTSSMKDENLESFGLGKENQRHQRVALSLGRSGCHGLSASVFSSKAPTLLRGKGTALEQHTMAT